MWNERHPKKSERVERVMAVNIPRKEPGELRVKEYTDEKYEGRFRELCKKYWERRKE